MSTLRPHDAWLREGKSDPGDGGDPVNKACIAATTRRPWQGPEPAEAGVPGGIGHQAD